MRLTAFRLLPEAPVIRPAAATREWMDATPERFAYRCLPLTIANSHGWEILCPESFEAHWTGEARTSSLTITGESGGPPSFVASHFGSGVITFHAGYLFQTEPGYSLYVTGGVNAGKDGVAPLTGIVETDWLAFPFTMNWRFTTVGGPVIFEKDEPFCQVFPIVHTLLEEVDPEIRLLESDRALKERYDSWSNARASFNRDLRVPGSEAEQQRWQKHYVRGKDAEGNAVAPDHRTRVRAKEFVERQPGQ